MENFTPELYTREILDVIKGREETQCDCPPVGKTEVWRKSLEPKRGTESPAGLRD